MANLSAMTGNVHSFIFCIDNGVQLSNNQKLIINASKYGYYTLLEQILKHVGNSRIDLGIDESYSIVSCGNISIVKLICDKFNPINRFILESAIEYDYDDIVQFVLNENLKSDRVFEIMKAAIECDSTDSFKIIVNKYPLKQQISIFNNNNFPSYCLCSCSNRNYEISCILIDYLCDCDSDLTKFFFKSFFSGSEEICKYIIDKKQNLNYSEIIENYDKLFAVNSTISVNLFDKFNPELKESLSRILFNESIKHKNKVVFESFIENNLDNRQLLTGAVSLRDIKLVKNVLAYKSNPSFINQVFKEGTALTIAASNGDIEIVQTLLELPGIDPNLSDEKGFTPLIIAISQLNTEMIGIFIDFYGDEIKYQTWQFRRSISAINDLYFNTDYPIVSKTEENIVFVLGGLLQIDEKLSLNGYSFLYNAIKKGMNQVVTFLFSIDTIDVNEKYNETGETALICAIKSNESQLAQFILDHPKIDVNISAYDTLTALTCATANNMKEIVQKIVNHPSFDPDSSNVNLAFFLSKDNEITNLLYSIKSLDVNYQLNPLLISKPDQNPKNSEFNYENWLHDYMENASKQNNQLGAHAAVFGNQQNYGAQNRFGQARNLVGFGQGARPAQLNQNAAGGFAQGARPAQLNQNAAVGFAQGARPAQLNQNRVFGQARNAARAPRPNHDVETTICLAPGKIEWTGEAPSLVETTLTYAVKSNDLQKVQLIIQHSSFNMTRSRTTHAIFYSANNSEIFKALFTLVNDANIVSNDGVSLFEFLFSQSKPDLIKVIIKDSNLNLSKNDLLKYYKKIMEMSGNSGEIGDRLLDCLIEYDQSHNHSIGISDSYQDALQNLINFND